MTINATELASQIEGNNIVFSYGKQIEIANALRQQDAEIKRLQALCHQKESLSAPVYVLFVRGEPFATQSTPFSISGYGDKTAVTQSVFTSGTAV